jgi:excisionase family DNA binding protein
MGNDQRLLSVAEVRARLGGISRARFYTLVREIDLPLIKLGRLTRVREADLAAYLATLSPRRRGRLDRRSGQFT